MSQFWCGFAMEVKCQLEPQLPHHITFRLRQKCFRILVPTLPPFEQEQSADPPLPSGPDPTNKIYRIALCNAHFKHCNELCQHFQPIRIFKMISP